MNDTNNEKRLNILFIDNFDSFTFNLVDEFEKNDCNVIVYSNNVKIDTIKKIVNDEKIDLIVISPGGYVPKEVPICKEVVLEFYDKIPIFGICLGHECIVEAFGGKIDRAPIPIHGKHSKIYHDGKTIYEKIFNPMLGGRYHSQVGYDIPESLEISSKTKDGIVMGVRHIDYFVEGVQFHPESILTPEGGILIQNIIKMVRER